MWLFSSMSLFSGNFDSRTSSKIKTKIMETLKVDRGLELNKKRIQGIETDICFLVDNESFPAHRLIVSLQSEYLKLLTATNSPFAEK